jgi:hypothetical protein
VNDRELLEAAAKAAEIPLDSDGDRTDIRENGGMPKRWNPLTNDGDALRLAVKLELDICHTPHEPPKVAVWVDADHDFIEEDRGTDHCAAWRRAIVRAAAAMVKP